MSDIVDMLKTEFDKASSGNLKGVDGMMAKLDFKHAVDSSPLAEEDDQEEYCDACDSVKSKCVCKKEPNEATGAGSAGGYSQPLFTKTKEEITKIEAKEATSSSSVGAYDAPGFEDVKMKGNHPRGSGRSYKKTQIPGGQFVKIKDKCKKFPYCNQGIGAIKLYGGKKLNEAIKNVSERMKIPEDTIREIIAYEYRNLLSK